MSGHTDGALNSEIAFMQKPFTSTGIAEKVKVALG